MTTWPLSNCGNCPCISKSPSHVIKKGVKFVKKNLRNENYRINQYTQFEVAHNALHLNEFYEWDKIKLAALNIRRVCA